MQVFISHAMADRELAGRLLSELQDAGVNVWNPDSIFPGDNWAKETGKALEASEVMVVLITKTSIRSSPSPQDVQYALTSGKYRGRVVPVFVGLKTVEAGADVPWILLRLDPIWLGEDTLDFASVVQRVQAEIEGRCSASA